MPKGEEPMKYFARVAAIVRALHLSQIIKLETGIERKVIRGLSYDYNFVKRNLMSEEVIPRQSR